MLQRQGPVDIIDVHRPLFYGCSSAWLCQDLLDSLASPSPVLLLDFNCPGGGWHGSDDIFDCLEEVKRVKRVCGIAHDQATSLAAALHALCHEAVATPTSTLGSIGTMLSPLWDVTEANKEAGVRVAIPHAGDFKTVGAYGAPVTPEAEAMLQRYVVSINDGFVARVAAGRGMTPEQIKSLQAAVFTAAQAKEAGLVDSVTSFRGYLSGLINRFGGRQRTGIGPMPAPQPEPDPESADAPEPPDDGEADQRTGVHAMSTASKTDVAASGAGTAAPAQAAAKTDPAAASAAAAPIPQAEQKASIEELEKIHGEDASAVLASFKAGHTRVQALEAANANLRTKVTQLGQAGAAQSAAGIKADGKTEAKPEPQQTTGVTGVKFVAAGSNATQLSPFERIVREYMDKHQCPRSSAVSACSMSHPAEFKAEYGEAMQMQAGGKSE